MDKKDFFNKITALVTAVLIIGCTGSPQPEPAQTVIGKWHGQKINADGNKTDWPRFAPQYKDNETNTKIWISNNTEQICLLAEVKDPGISRQLTQGSLILSVETGEKEAKPFSIQLKGHTPFSPRGEQRDPMPDITLPDSLIVIYPFSSSPVTMSMKEARSIGISLGLVETGRHTLIFEATISLDAIFFDVPRIAGTAINIALSAKTRSFAMKRRESPDDNKTDRPKGGPPVRGTSDRGASGTDHGPSKPDDIKQIKASDESFRAAVEITLAGPSK